jgi:hypothetical protein
VVDFYDAQFTNPITINVDVGFGEVEGYGLPPLRAIHHCPGKNRPRLRALRSRRA